MNVGTKASEVKEGSFDNDLSGSASVLDNVSEELSPRLVLSVVCLVCNLMADRGFLA